VIDSLVDSSVVEAEFELTLREPEVCLEWKIGWVGVDAIRRSGSRVEYATSHHASSTVVLTPIVRIHHGRLRGAISKENFELIVLVARNASMKHQQSVHLPIVIERQVRSG